MARRLGLSGSPIWIRGRIFLIAHSARAEVYRIVSQEITEDGNTTEEILFRSL